MLSTITVRVIAVELLPAAIAADEVQVTKFRKTLQAHPFAAPALTLPGAEVKPFALTVVSDLGDSGDKLMLTVMRPADAALPVFATQS